MNSEVRRDYVEAALERVLGSRTLAGSGQLRNLLEYLVRNTLDGRTSQLNELAVAENVLGRGRDFVTQEDSSARKALSRLRGRLKAYYSDEGSWSEIRFVICRYTVRFEPCESCRLRVLLLPLQAVNFRDEHYLTAELTEELMLALAAHGALEVVPWTAAHMLASVGDLRERTRLTGADIVLDGTVRRQGLRAYRITLMPVNGSTVVFDTYFQARVGERGRREAMRGLASRIVRESGRQFTRSGDPLPSDFSIAPVTTVGQDASHGLV